MLEKILNFHRISEPKTASERSVAEKRGSTPISRSELQMGTTLVEILVVIVVFLVGILAVVQIFPKGFQTLSLSRSAAQATYQAKEEMESLKARPDTLPDQILPVDADTDAADPNIPTDILGLFGTQISKQGFVTLPNGATTDPSGALINWEAVNSFNNVRRIVGESQIVPAPRFVGSTAAYYGGVMVLQFGPISYLPTTNGGQGNLTAYGNDLTMNIGVPDPTATRADYEYFLQNDPGTLPVLYVPTGAEVNGRLYRVSFSAYVSVGPTNTVYKRNYVVTLPTVLPTTPDPTTGNYPLQQIQMSTLVNAGETLTAVDTNSIQLQRQFRLIPVTQAWSGDVYEYKILSSTLGSLLFTPRAYNVWITKPGSPREALRARVTYDVDDWRVLREDFRVDPSTPSSHQLPIQSLRTASQPNVDGTQTTASPSQGFSFENLPSDAKGVDHFMLIDLLTGGTFFENGFITVDKSRGLINFGDVDATRPGIQGNLLLPDGTTEEVDMAGRSVRALYQARDEWGLQVLKASSLYTLSTGRPGVAQYMVGTTTRLYFPPCDARLRVSVGEIFYQRQDGVLRSLQDQAFQIHPAASNDPVGLPYIDVQDVDSAAVSLNQTTYGYAARDVKGSSVLVRVVWNPNSFTLTTNGTQNATTESTWAQGWRRNTTETYLDQGVSSR